MSDKPAHLNIGKPFSEKYKNAFFEHWFNQGKPGYATAHKIAFPDEYGRIPSTVTVRHWYEDEWKPRGELLDEMVMAEMNERIVHEKVEMLKRHAETAKKFQERAEELLEMFDPDQFTASAVIRLWTEGVRIERESVGIPQALEKMMSLSDEELLNKFEEIVRSSPGTIEKLEDGDN